VSPMSAARCAICRDGRRREIENAHLGGESIRSIAARIGRSKGTVHRHLRQHISTAAVEASAARRAITHREAGDGILGEPRSGDSGGRTYC